MLGITNDGYFVYENYLRGPITFKYMHYTGLGNEYISLPWIDGGSPTFKILVRGV